MPTTLQRELAAAARDVLAREAQPSASDPERSSSGALWERIVELGWPTLTIPTHRGGLGGSWADLGAVLAEAGAVLLGVPLADTAVAAWLVERLTADGTPFFEPAAGTTATVAFDSAVEAAPDGSGARLDGAARFVLHGADADVLVVPVRLGREPAVVVVRPTEHQGISRRRVATADRTRPVGDVLFAGALVGADRVIGRGTAAVAALDASRALRAAASCAEAVGGIDRVLEMAVEYARARHQFGRPIGSFQAVQHQLADVLIAAEEARTATARVLDCDPAAPGFIGDAALARAFVAAAFQRAAARNIHVHGGIGFTWEHPAHLYYKRAVTDALLTWPAADCRAIVRSSLFAPAVSP